MKRGLRRYEKSPEPAESEDEAWEGAAHAYHQREQLDEKRLKVLVDLGYPQEYVLRVL